MLIPRIYCEERLTVGQKILLNEEIRHYLKQVLRLQPNNELILFDNSGIQYLSRLLAFEKKTVWVQVNAAQTTTTDASLPVHLGQVISRGERMDYTIQKSVELGVTAITPLLSERCGVKLSTERLLSRQQHWHEVMVHACQQCGRNRLAIIHPPQPLAAWARAAIGLRLICAPTATPKPLPLELTDATGVSVLVGSEGGLTAAEIQLTIDAGFTEFYLGPRILRTETAAVVALTLIQSRWGDLKAV